MGFISIEKIKEDILSEQEIVVLDVRERNLYQRYGNIGATNYPINEIKNGTLNPKADFEGFEGKIILICSGNGRYSMRTASAEQQFRKMGFYNVYRLNTGLFEWAKKYGKLDRIPDFLAKIKAKNG